MWKPITDKQKSGAALIVNDGTVWEKAYWSYLRKSWIESTCATVIHPTHYYDIPELDMNNASKAPETPPDQFSAQRGASLRDALQIINGERQDVYGSPEDSFALIAEYWNAYLTKGSRIIKGPLSAKDVALMMVLFKIAREANQHKKDNIVDAAGYLGIYGDMIAPEGEVAQQIDSAFMEAHRKNG